MLAYKNGSEGSEKMKYITRLANLVIVRLIKREPPYKSPSPHGTYIRWVPIIGILEKKCGHYRKRKTFFLFYLHISIR